MSGYLLNFIVYTIAMVGLIFLAVFIYKKCVIDGGLSSGDNFLQVEDAINLAPRKQLYIIRAGKEKFLIASDMERTTLISKLGDNVSKISQIKPEQTQEYNSEENISVIDKKIKNIQEIKNSKDVIKNLAKKVSSI